MVMREAVAMETLSSTLCHPQTCLLPEGRAKSAGKNEARNPRVLQVHMMGRHHGLKQRGQGMCLLGFQLHNRRQRLWEEQWGELGCLKSDCMDLNPPPALGGCVTSLNFRSQTWKMRVIEYGLTGSS